MKKYVKYALSAVAVGAALLFSACGSPKHDYDITVVEPTCTESGYTLYTCIDDGCGYSYKADEVSALGHSYVENFCERCDILDPNAPYTEELDYLPIYDINDGTRIKALSVSKGSAEIFNYIKIPDQRKVDGISYEITRIDDGAFENCDGVKKAVIPSSVKEIGSRAFADCGTLSNAALPSGVKVIGDEAFADCAALRNVEMPSAIEVIGAGAFSNCVFAFDDLKLPNGLKDIGCGAFSGCDNIGSVTMRYVVGETEKYVETDPDGGEPIEKERRVNTHFGYMFGARSYADNGEKVPSSLEKITIEGSFDIPDNAFYGCSSLRSVSIPTTVREIGKSAFEGCSSLESLTMPYIVGETEKYIETDPAGGKPIEKERRVNTHFGFIFGALSYADNGEKVPSSLAGVELIGRYDIPDFAFYGCAVGGVKIGGDISVIGKSAFENCTSLAYAEFASKLTAIGEKAFKNCASAFDKIVLPDSVKEIGYAAFEGCDKAEHAEMPYALGGDGSGRHFGYLFGGDDASAVPASLRTVKITGGLSVGDNAFKGCGGIVGAEIVGELKSIGASAFADCAALESIVLGKNVTELHAGVFVGCRRLKRVDFEGSLAQYLDIMYEDEYSSPLRYGAELYVKGQHIDIPA